MEESGARLTELDGSSLLVINLYVLTFGHLFIIMMFNFRVSVHFRISYSVHLAARFCTFTLKILHWHLIVYHA